jgi:hypothetical protein
MLRVIYRREFHIYLTALYAVRRAKAYFDAFGSDEYATTNQGGRVASASYVQYNTQSIHIRLHPRRTWEEADIDKSMKSKICDTFLHWSTGDVFTARRAFQRLA